MTAGAARQRVGIVDPLTLLGKELRERVDSEPVRLLSDDPEQAGTLTEVGGGAAILSAIGDDPEEALEGLDLVYFCGPYDRSLELAAARRPGATAVIVTPGAPRDAGVPVVGGVNDGDATAGAILLNPPPGAVLTAILIAALRRLEPVEASATILHAASGFGESALQELFDQARALLTFSTQPESAHFGQQLAFNLFLEPAAGPLMVDHLDAVLGGRPAVTAQGLLAGVFHGVSASLCIRFSEVRSAAAVREALAESSAGAVFPDPDEGALGPVAAAQSEALLVGGIRADRLRPDRVWIWAAADNLTRCGAGNALAIARAAGF